MRSPERRQNRVLDTNTWSTDGRRAPTDASDRGSRWTLDRYPRPHAQYPCPGLPADSCLCAYTACMRRAPRGMAGAAGGLHSLFLWSTERRVGHCAWRYRRRHRPLALHKLQCIYGSREGVTRHRPTVYRRTERQFAGLGRSTARDARHSCRAEGASPRLHALQRRSLLDISRRRYSRARGDVSKCYYVPVDGNIPAAKEPWRTTIMEERNATAYSGPEARKKSDISGRKEGAFGTMCASRYLVSAVSFLL